MFSACTTDTDSLDEPNVSDTRSIVEVINQYRVEQGLLAIPQSASLMKVAQAHVDDLEQGQAVGGECNLHSWSNQGNWSACCYTDDHAEAECMWNKPYEITEGLYGGNGYEISAMYSGTMNALKALDMWRGSEGHHNVIVNKATWSDNKWNAIGGAVSKHYAVVWFGEEIENQN